MVDFLKSFPFISLEDYLWGYSIPMLRIMGIDNSHIRYLSEKQAKNRNTPVSSGNNQSAQDLAKSLGGFGL